MLAMHYAFVLDDDFDMDTIRRRVAEKAGRYDRYPGLCFKAFVMTERGAWRRGEPARNLYGAFYLWDSAEAAEAFLRSDDFGAVVQSFGRPEVQTWLVLEPKLPQTGALAGPPPKVVSYERVALPREARAVDAIGLIGGLGGPSEQPSGGFVGLDPKSWEAARIRLWPDAESIPPSAGKGRRYELLHLSAPSEASLAAVAG